MCSCFCDVQVTALVCICINVLLSMFSLLRRKGANGGQRSGEGGEQLRQPFKKKAEPDQEPRV